MKCDTCSQEVGSIVLSGNTRRCMPCFEQMRRLTQEIKRGDTVLVRDSGGIFVKAEVSAFVRTLEQVYVTIQCADGSRDIKLVPLRNVEKVGSASV